MLKCTQVISRIISTILLLCITFTNVNYIFAQDLSNLSTTTEQVEKKVESQQLENLFVTCINSTNTPQNTEISTTTEHAPICIVWSLNNSSISESQNTEPLQILGFLNARYYDGYF